MTDGPEHISDVVGRIIQATPGLQLFKFMDGPNEGVVSISNDHGRIWLKKEHQEAVFRFLAREFIGKNVLPFPSRDVEK